MRIFRFIAAARAEHSIQLMCRVLGVSRSGFHAWQRRPPSARSVADQALTARIAEIHAGSMKTYGSPRVHAELRLEDGIQVGRKRVERLMRAAGLSGQLTRRRGKTTTVMEALLAVAASVTIGVPVGLALGLLAVRALGLFFTLPPPLLDVPALGLVVFVVLMALACALALAASLSRVRRTSAAAVLREP